MAQLRSGDKASDFMGIVRSAFLVDENGRIAAAWYGISPQKTMPELFKAIG